MLLGQEAKALYTVWKQFSTAPWGALHFFYRFPGRFGKAIKHYINKT